MSEKLRHNDQRALSLEDSKIDHQRIKIAADEFIRLLPEHTIHGGEEIPFELLADDTLFHVIGVGSIVAAASGKESTKVRDIWQSVLLGLNHYDYPPKSADLQDLSAQYPLVHFNRWSEEFPDERERLLKNILNFSVIPQTDEGRKELLDYLDHGAPMGKLWTVIAINDALERVNDLTGHQLLDSDRKIYELYKDNVRLVYGVSGTGNVLAHHDREHGRIHKQTLTDLLDNDVAGFAAHMFGIGKTETISGACAATSKAVALAEVIAASRLNTVGLFIIASNYDGPTSETFQMFRSANIPQGDGLPYVYKHPPGYTEAPAATASIYMTKQFAKELRIDPTHLEYVHSETAQGSNRFGADKTLFRDLYQAGFDAIGTFYGNGYDGVIVISTHGANTTGWVYEIQALKEVKKQFPSATVIITSSQPQMGHSYSNRQIISAELGSYSRKMGVLYGMARASENVSFFGQEEPQEYRREAINQYIPEYAAPVRPCTFGRETEQEETKYRNKAVALLQELADQNIYIAFAPVKVPNTFPHMVVHTGLNGEGGVNVFIPVKA
jgi:hypothetical protein